MGLGTLALRSVVGGIILAHGLQKLNGSFGGPGLEGTEKMMESLGLHPAKYQAWAVAMTETVGGGLTAAGFLSPLGPAMIIGSQAVAVQKVHLKNGFWLHNRGYEYNLALMAGAFALAETGPGALSLDALFGKRRQGLGWALASTAVALSAAAATLKVAKRMAPDGAPAGSTGAGAEATPAGSTGAFQAGAS
jgi:putative oxidoreductase